MGLGEILNAVGLPNQALPVSPPPRPPTLGEGTGGNQASGGVCGMRLLGR